MGAGCGFSRRRTCRNAADRRSVAETTMRPGEAVVLEPGRKISITFFGVDVVASVGPFAKSGLDEAFSFAVGAGCSQLSPHSIEDPLN